MYCGENKLYRVFNSDAADVSEIVRRRSASHRRHKTTGIIALPEVFLRPIRGGREIATPVGLGQ